MTHLLLATLLVLNKADSNLAFVDPNTLQVIAKIATGNAPHEARLITLTECDPIFVASGAIDWICGSDANVTHMLVVTPDEKKIYTANIGSHSVSVINLANAPRGVVVKQIAVGKSPEGIDLSPDGREVWVAHVGDGALSIIDTASDKVAQTVTIGTKMANRVKFTRDGKRVLISDPPSNQVLVYDAASRQLVKKIDTEAGPEGILIAPDGKRAFIACSDAGKVAVLDLDTLTITRSVTTGNQPDGMAWADRQ